jgi:hypothetical protein
VLSSQVLHLCCLSFSSNVSVCETVVAACSLLASRVCLVMSGVNRPEDQQQEEDKGSGPRDHPFTASALFLTTVVLLLVVMPVAGSMLGTARPQIMYLALGGIAAMAYLVACTAWWRRRRAQKRAER